MILYSINSTVIRVYHNKDFLQYNLSDQTKLPPTTLQLAASVATDSLDKAFELTNNIDSEWTKNPEVRASGYSPRSTSVGDVLEQDRKFYVVQTAGFRELSKEEIAQLNIYYI